MKSRVKMGSLDCKAPESKVFLHRIMGLLYYLRLLTGELAEWLKAAVLKTAVG